MTFNKQRGIRGLVIRIREQNPDLIHEKIFQNLAYLGSGTFLAQILMAINAILLARYLGPQNFGIFTGTYAAVGLTSFFLNWGLDTWLLRESSVSKEPSRLLGKVFLIKIAFGIPWGSSYSWYYQYSNGFFQTSLTIFVISDIMFDGLLNAEMTAMNAQKRVPVVSSLLFLSRGSRLFITIFMIVMGVNSPTIFAAGRFLGTTLALLTSLTLFTPKFYGVSLQDEKSTFRRAIPYGFSELLAIVYMQADVTLIALLIGTGEAVGLYACLQFNQCTLRHPTGWIFCIGTCVNQTISRTILIFQAHDNPGFRWIFNPGIILTLGIWIAGPFLSDLLLGDSTKRPANYSGS
jgi:O-antigen/teichoic acid export membrane protein